MFCRNCGHKLKDEALFCPKCGAGVRTAASPSPDKPPVSTPPLEGGKSQDILKPASPGKTKGKPVGLFCCLGLIGIVCVAVVVFLFLRMQGARHAGEPSAIAIADGDTSITSAKAAKELPDITEVAKEPSGLPERAGEPSGVLETSEKTSDATIADNSGESSSEAADNSEELPPAAEEGAAESGTANAQEESVAEGTIQETVRETAQESPMSQEELEAEVARIRQVWQSDRESISNGSFGHKELENHVQVYELNGEIRMIEIPKGNGNDFSRTFQIEDGRLTFAFYDSPESQIRLYYKDDRLFRWIQTDAGKDAVIHDQESGNTEFNQNGQRALSEIYEILGNLAHTR